MENTQTVIEEMKSETRTRISNGGCVQVEVELLRKDIEEIMDEGTKEEENLWTKTVNGSII